jgi:hypothetical protein
MDSTAEVERQEEHTLTFYHNHTDKWLTVTSVVNEDSAANQRDATGLGRVNSGLSANACPEPVVTTEKVALHINTYTVSGFFSPAIR